MDRNKQHSLKRRGKLMFYIIMNAIVLVFMCFLCFFLNSDDQMKHTKQQAQRRAAAGRSRHKSQGVIQY